MEGFVQKKGTKGLQTWKSRWFVLQEGTLLYFSKQGGKLKGAIAIKGVTVDDSENSKSDRRQIFKLQFSEPGKIKWFAVNSVEEKAKWVKSIREHATMEPAVVQAPAKKSAMYAIGSAATGSALGKLVLKKVIDKDVWVLVDAASAFLAAYRDEATAAAFHEDIVKVLTKIALLYQDNHISDDQTKELFKYGLKLTQHTIDYFQMPSIFDGALLLGIIKETKAFVETTFGPKLTPKNAARLTRAFSYFEDEPLLTDFFAKNKWKELGEIVAILRTHLGQLHPTSS